MKGKAITKIQAIIVIVVIIIAALSVALIYVTLPKPPAPPVEDVYIGAILPLTGPYETSGKAALNGVRLGVDDVNKKGGIKSLGGAKLRLCVADTGGTIAEASSSFERLLAKYPQIVAAIGAWASAYTLAIQPIAEKAEVPIFPSSWGEPITEKGYKYTFRLCGNATMLVKSSFVQTQAVFKYMYGRDLKTVAVVSDDTAGVAYTVKPFEENCKKAGIQLLYKEMFTPPLLDATPMITKLKAANSDLFVVSTASTADALLLLRKADEMGVKVVRMGMGGGFLTPEFIAAMGKYAEGMIVWSDWNTVKGCEWLQEMYKEYYGVPFMPKDAAYHYAAVWIIARALEMCGTRSGRDVRNAVLKMDLRPPDPIAQIMYNRLKWHEAGDLVEEGAWRTVIVQWQHGIPQTVYPPELATVSIIMP